MRVVLRDGRRGRAVGLKQRRTRWLLTVELDTGGTTRVELTCLRSPFPAHARAHAREAVRT